MSFIVLSYAFYLSKPVKLSLPGTYCTTKLCPNKDNIQQIYSETSLHVLCPSSFLGNSYEKQNKEEKQTQPSHSAICSPHL